MFLKEAAKDRMFEVFITECGPNNHVNKRTEVIIMICLFHKFLYIALG